MINKQLTLREKLDKIDKPEINKVQSSYSVTVEDFWNTVIVPNLPSDKTIIEYHKLLTKYIAKTDNITLGIRAHFSDNKNHENLRRGWLNRMKDDNGTLKFFFTDNFFAHYFAKMARDNFVPDFDEFCDVLEKREFPFRINFFDCVEEREFRSLKSGKNVGIVGSGNYLAHVLDAGKHFYINSKEPDLGRAEIENKYILKGQRTDWKLENDATGDYYIRDLGYCNDLTLRKILVAFFIRFTHPINYFICPNKNSSICGVNLISDRNRKRIGESVELISYAHNYFLTKFPDIYKEFLDLALAPKEYYSLMKDTSKNIINIVCDYNINIDSVDNDDDVSEDDVDNQEIEEIVKNEDKFELLPKSTSNKTKNVFNKINNVISTSSLKIKNATELLIVSGILALNKEGKLTQFDIDVLSSDYSLELFAIRYPVLADKAHIVKNKYLKNPTLTFNGKEYYFTNDWYLTNDRVIKILNWLNMKNI